MIFFITLSLTILYFIPVNSPNYLASTIEKHNLLRKTLPPRIIFIGGSNIAFGLDSEMIQKKLHYPVINIGLYGHLGLKFMLNEVKPYIKAKDILVIIPEYEQFFGSLCDGKRDTLMLMLDVNPPSIKYFTLNQIIRTIPTLFNYKRRTLVYLIKGSVPFDPIYCRNAFNKNGDVIIHLRDWYQIDDAVAKKLKNKINPDKFKNIKELKYIKFQKQELTDTLEKLDFNREEIDLISSASIIRQRMGLPNLIAEKLNTHTIFLLNKFKLYARKRQAKVFFIYPNYSLREYKINKKQIISLKKELEENLLIEIIGSPENYVFPDNYFFDTNYHLMEEGRKIRTDKVIEDLKKVIN